MGTKIHTVVDALGNPTGFFLTGGQAHDLVGADHLPPGVDAGTLIADKAFDADRRVAPPLAAAGKKVVIPTKANRRVARDDDRHLHKARHLIENFFAKLKQSARWQPATTKPLATSPAASTLPPLWSGSIDDAP